MTADGRRGDAIGIVSQNGGPAVLQADRRGGQPPGLLRGNAQVHSTPLSEATVGSRRCDVAATEGARRATGVAATSLAAARGYPWPVVKLACFGQRSWRELKAHVQELVPRRSPCSSKAKDVASRADIGSSCARRAGRQVAELVGGDRAPAKPSSWALAAEMERYLAAHTAPPNVKTVRTIRT